MPETTESRTWTKYAFTCQDCKQLCYASQEAIDEARKDCGYGPELTDAEVAEFDFCLSCLEGQLIPGEKVALQPMRVFVHEATVLGWAKWESRECDIAECFPNDIDEAIRVRAELEENGYAWVGGGAAALYMLTRKPGQTAPPAQTYDEACDERSYGDPYRDPDEK